MPWKPVQAPGPGDPVKLEPTKPAIKLPRLEPLTSAPQSVVSATEPHNVPHKLEIMYIYKLCATRAQLEIDLHLLHCRAGPRKNSHSQKLINIRRTRTHDQAYW